jgi:hypothetical protein
MHSSHRTAIFAFIAVAAFLSGLAIICQERRGISHPVWTVRINRSPNCSGTTVYEVPSIQSGAVRHQVVQHGDENLVDLPVELKTYFVDGMFRQTEEPDIRNVVIDMFCNDVGKERFVGRFHLERIEIFGRRKVLCALVETRL